MFFRYNVHKSSGIKALSHLFGKLVLIIGLQLIVELLGLISSGIAIGLFFLHALSKQLSRAEIILFHNFFCSIFSRMY